MDGTTTFDPARAERPITPAHATWAELELAEPELAGAVRARFDATKHHVLATLRADGAPRVSGTEVILAHGVLAIGSMWLSVKALDLRRDARFALHSNPGDGSMEGGDAKLSGRAVELTGELAVEIAATISDDRPSEDAPDEGAPDEGAVPGPFHLFRLDLSQVVLSEVDHGRNCMVVRSWRPDRGVVTAER